MREFIEIGQAPANEYHAPVGIDPNYETNARRQCRAFIQAIRNYLGPEPDGAELGIKWSPHDFGRYADVVCYYDPDDQAAVEYAFKCEAKAPLTWADGGVPAPELIEEKARGR